VDYTSWELITAVRRECPGEDNQVAWSLQFGGKNHKLILQLFVIFYYQQLL
jgi:hypothetical protein